MLELRSTCERCGVGLPGQSTGAWICSFECTFCATCTREVLRNVCPNCGGGFQPRPVRVRNEWRDGVSLQHQPASTESLHRPVDRTHVALVARVGGIKPEQR